MSGKSNGNATASGGWRDDPFRIHKVNVISTTDGVIFELSAGNGAFVGAFGFDAKMAREFAREIQARANEVDAMNGKISLVVAQ